MLSRSVFTVLVIVGLGFCSGDERMIGLSNDVTHMLKAVLGAYDATFAAIRHPIAGKDSRHAMQTFIQNRLELMKVSAGQKGFNARNETSHFNTTILHLGETRLVDGTNLMFILEGSVNKSQDEPLMLLANYDTGLVSNAINEGSGVAALLVLIETLLNEMAQKQHKIENSIVFAFTDVAYKKYSGNHAPGGTTGAGFIAKYWLPKYLADKKSFRGAIVLDNLMNYNDQPQSQLVANLGLDKSFPEAYAKISEANFAGDFLGLLHRDDELDKTLVRNFKDAWRNSLKPPTESQSGNDEGSDMYLNPRLIKFTFKTDTFPSASVNEFLNSEQSAFWNYDSNVHQYPAITLTDTRHHRDGICRMNCGNVESMTTRTNMAFLKRTVTTLQSLILNMQTDAGGALSNFHSSIILIIAPLLTYIINTFNNRV